MAHTTPLLIQVVAQLKPGRCGVSDQAVLLAEELRVAFEIETAFVVLNSDEKCSLPFPVIHCAQSQLLDSCLAPSGTLPAALLVHVSGYGFSPDGAPALLAEALARVKADGRFSIAAYFHELFAKGMPWQSAFWHSTRQQKAVRRIAELCDLVVTNTSYHANWLERETTRRSSAPIQLMPVFSAAGEAPSPAPVSGRDPTMVVFGLPASRQRAYSHLASEATILSELGVKTIVDIGAESAVPSEVNGIPVRCRGALAISELASELSRAKFGFLPHAAAYLAKSSIFAAYCAHGTIPVIATPFDGEVDGLKDGVHLISPKTVSTVKATGLDRCSQAAWQWYSQHRVHAHAATYARWLDQPAVLREQNQAAS
jgi:hypothetical protein